VEELGQSVDTPIGWRQFEKSGIQKWKVQAVVMDQTNA